MSPRAIHLATGNPHKAAEFQRLARARPKFHQLPQE